MSKEWVAGRNGYWLRLKDWGSYTYEGFYCGHPSPGDRDESDMHTLDEALSRAFMLRLSGRHPIEIWYDGECVYELTDGRKHP